VTVGHYIKLCRVCKAVIEQCRCPAIDKDVQWATCWSCIDRQREKNRKRYEGDKDGKP
jgi:hypothetical protein